MGFGLGSALGGFASSAVGGYFKKEGARKASRAANKGIRQANALLNQNFDTTAGEYRPYMDAGTDSLAALMATYGLGGRPADYSGFEDSPDYQFALQQGGKAVDQSGSARGLAFSGGQLKALQGFGQGLASNQLGNYRKGLQGLTNLGYDATQGLGGLREGLSNTLSNNLIGIGQNNAAYQLAKGNYRSGLVKSAEKAATSYFGGSTGVS